MFGICVSCLLGGPVGVVCAVGTVVVTSIILINNASDKKKINNEKKKYESNIKQMHKRNEAELKINRKTMKEMTDKHISKVKAEMNENYEASPLYMFESANVDAAEEQKSR